MPPITAQSVFQKIQDAVDAVPTNRASYTRAQVKDKIQLKLINELKRLLPEEIYKWEKEAFAEGQNSLDRIDILGTPKPGMYDEKKGGPLPKVVVEIDTHRADQISKKFVSRQAIFNERPLIYVVYIYPNKHAAREAELKECRKYLEYLTTLSNALDVQLITRCPEP